MGARARAAGHARALARREAGAAGPWVAPRSGISPWGSGSRHGPDEERQPTARTYDAVTQAQAQRVGSDRRRKERVMTWAVDTTRTRAELRRFRGWIGSIVHGI